MRMNFSTKPVESSTLLVLSEKRMEKTLKTKIRQFCYTNGISVQDDEVFYDFVEYMSGEGKVFNPELYANKDFKEYDIKPYLFARLNAYLMSTFSRYMHKVKFELNIVEQDADEEVNYSNTVNSNYVSDSRDEDYQTITYDSTYKEYCEEVKFFKREVGLDVLKYVIVKLGEAESKDRMDMLIQQRMSSDEFNTLDKLVQADKVYFGSETGFNMYVNNNSDALDWLTSLTGQNVRFIYATQVEEGSETPLQDTVDVLADKYGIPNMGNLINNIVIKSKGLRKTATINYLSGLFDTKGINCTIDGKIMRGSISNLYRYYAGQDRKNIVRNILNALNSTGLIEKMYLLALKSRFESAKRNPYILALQKLVKNLVPYIAGKSRYGLDSLLQDTQLEVE